MTTSLVPPIIPKVVPGRHGESGPAGRSRPPLPVAALASVSPAAVDTIYALSMVDKSGRVTDRSMVRELGWRPGTRLDIRERRGIIVVSPAASGVDSISRQAFLKLPLTVRRWCRIKTGDKVLLAAHHAVGVLVVHPVAALHALLADVHAAAVRGDAA
ncbi:AbrB/MazE/SpoVT family DNA-binding domain-containing protein [Rugosimonospora africana]|uniref:AbrB/MazE/SpoVT family DNA-binding domain-containing protein n=1 Tax=Rugosimonospora africana TaxID=556532 RepID=UPI0019453298|nr:AbrB/MazE/SpoVT family DNA-binding domain-containing protein [Rugosimonospora africana]